MAKNEKDGQQQVLARKRGLRSPRLCAGVKKQLASHSPSAPARSLSSMTAYKPRPPRVFRSRYIYIYIRNNQSWMFSPVNLPLLVWLLSQLDELGKQEEDHFFTPAQNRVHIKTQTRTIQHYAVVCS